MSRELEAADGGCDGGGWGVKVLSGERLGCLSPLSSSSTHCREDCNDIITIMGEKQKVFERYMLEIGGGTTDKNAVCVRFAKSLLACQTAVFSPFLVLVHSSTTQSLMFSCTFPPHNR